MKPSVKLIQRLRVADELLTREGLHVASFAEQQGIPRKSVLRMLALLKELGHPTVLRSRWRPVRPVRPLFL